MPRSFWYWSLRQSIQVMNYFPCTVSGISTTPHELVYGINPDLHILFWSFSMGYFRKSKDSTQHRSCISTSTSMQGIALVRCRKTDVIIFYSPLSKELYISSDSLAFTIITNLLLLNHSLKELQSFTLPNFILPRLLQLTWEALSSLFLFPNHSLLWRTPYWGTILQENRRALNLKFYFILFYSYSPTTKWYSFVRSGCFPICNMVGWWICSSGFSRGPRKIGNPDTKHRLWV